MTKTKRWKQSNVTNNNKTKTTTNQSEKRASPPLPESDTPIPPHEEMHSTPVPCADLSTQGAGPAGAGCTVQAALAAAAAVAPARIRGTVAPGTTMMIPMQLTLLR